MLAGRFDLEPAEIEANAAVLAGYEAMDELDVRTLHWFVPAFDNAVRRRHPDHPALRRSREPPPRRHQQLQRVRLRRPGHGKRRRAIGSERRSPPCPAPPCSAHRQRPAPCDAALASSWASIYPLVRFTGARAKLVFVQDWESDFEPAGSTRALLEQAARLGLPGLVNTPALADSWRELRQPRGLVHARRGHRPVPSSRRRAS